METFRKKFVFYKSPNTHSPVLPAARKALGFLSRWSSIFPFQHFFQNCHIIPLSLTPATKYFTLVLRCLRYRGKRTVALSKVVPNTTTGTSKTSHPHCPCVTCRRVFVSWTSYKEQQQQDRSCLHLRSGVNGWTRGIPLASLSFMTFSFMISSFVLCDVLKMKCCCSCTQVACGNRWEGGFSKPHTMKCIKDVNHSICHVFLCSGGLLGCSLLWHHQIYCMHLWLLNDIQLSSNTSRAKFSCSSRFSFFHWDHKSQSRSFFRSFSLSRVKKSGRCFIPPQVRGSPKTHGGAWNCHSFVSIHTGGCACASKKFILTTLCDRG